MPSFWVAELRVSDRVAQKIAQKHGLSWEDVYDALVGQSGLRGVWDHDPERGSRALVEIVVSGRTAVAVLYPTDGADDVWNLGSCYRR